MARPGPAAGQHARRPPLAVQPGLDGGAQPRPRGGGAGARGPRRHTGRPSRPDPRGPAVAGGGAGGPAVTGAARAAAEGAAQAAWPAAGAATDDELVGAVAGGDRAALELLYRRHAPWLAGRLAARTSSRDLAEEALQDTFLAAWRSASAYK